MSWLFSRALVAASSAGTCSDGAPSAPSSTTPTPQAYLCRDKTTDAWRRFPSGMTCEHLTDGHGEELLTSYLAGFPAKTFPLPDEGQESTEKDPDCGQKWLGSLARYDRVSRSWKTRQCLLLGDLAEYAETWPSWGMTRSGELFRRPTPSSLLAIRARITCDKESGLSLPTPRANDAEKRGDFDASNLRNGLPAAVKRLSLPTPRKQEPGRTTKGYGRGLAELLEGREQLPTPQARDYRGGQQSRWDDPDRTRNLNDKIGGKLNPQWVEWLMGWPIGWTDLAALEMDKWQQWRQWHGDF